MKETRGPSPLTAVISRRLTASLARRVGLYGPYASRNLGDTAIQMAVIANVRDRWPGVEIVGICSDPRDTLKTHHIAAFPMSGDPADMVPAASGTSSPGWRIWLLERVSRRAAALWNISSFVRSLEVLIVSGGGQLDDFWGGPWEGPFQLLVWTALARSHGVKVAVFGIGLDDLSTRLGKLFSLGTLRLAQYRAFRDLGTLAALQADGFRSPSRVYPDPAFSLPLALVEQIERPAPDSPFAVVSPISEKAMRSADSDYENYLRELASTCERVIQSGIKVRFLCSQRVMDATPVHRVANMLKERRQEMWEICDAPTVQSYLAAVRGAHFVIASRLHALILAIVAGSPVIAVSYSRKVRQLMQDVGLEEYCVDLPAATSVTLMQLATSVLKDAASVRAHIVGQATASRVALASAYDEMLRLL